VQLARSLAAVRTPAIWATLPLPESPVRTDDLGRLALLLRGLRAGMMRTMGRASRAGPARKQPAGPGLGRYCSPWAGTTRHAENQCRARHNTKFIGPAGLGLGPGRAARMDIYN
jgi:hypothetical protein